MENLFVDMQRLQLLQLDLSALTVAESVLRSSDFGLRSHLRVHLWPYNRLHQCNVIVKNDASQLSMVDRKTVANVEWLQIQNLLTVRRSRNCVDCSPQADQPAGCVNSRV